MSNEFSKAFVQQYSNNVSLMVQQQGSRLRPHVMEESVTGEKAFFDQIGSVTAQVRASRHADTPLVETPHGRRMVVMVDYEVADLIDDMDKAKALIDPASSYAQAQAWAMGRAIDDVIIEALGGTAYTGKTGATPVILPAGQVVAASSSGLTVAKLREARRKLIAGNVDPMEQMYIAVTAKQLDDLLGTTEVTSADYNSVRTLVSGDIDTFLGFTFVQTEQLPASGSVRDCFVWAKTGMMLAMCVEPTCRVTERPDKSYATQAYYSMSLGATRMEEAKVVKVQCSE